MILLLVGGWTGLLWLLVKIGVLKKWYTWMKVSPAVIGVVAFLAIFLPLNWNVPMGGTTVTVGSVGIKPGVGGPVTEVVASSWKPIARGEVLFEIDKTTFTAALRQAEAQLALARDQLSRKEELLKRNTVAAAEVEVQRSGVAVAEAALTVAEVNLANATVRAPFDGIIPAMTLLPGNRVSPNVAVMAFLDDGNPVVNLILAQNQMRNVKTGQRAEAIFRAFPGRTFEGTVNGVYLSSPDAEYTLDGATPELPTISDTRYTVTLDLDLGGLTLPPGSSGKGAVFTGHGTQFQFIQQLTLRMGTWMNFF